MQFLTRALTFSMGTTIWVALSSSLGPAHGSEGNATAGLLIPELVTPPAYIAAANAANSTVHSIDLSTGSAAISLQPPSTGGAEYRLELKARQHDPGRILDQPLARSDLVTVDGEVSYEDLARLRLEGRLFEFAAPADNEMFALDEDFAFMNSAGADWEANRVNDAQLTVTLLDDRLRLTSRRASSSYGPSVPYIERPTVGLEPNGNVFSSRSTAEGDAFLHRLDADIRRSEDLSISIFGLYSKMDSDYQYRSPLSGEPFGQRNSSSRKIGTTLSWSPVDLSLAHERSRKLDGPDEAQYEANIGVGLANLWPRLGGNDEGLWAFAPSSTWASVALGEVGSGTGDQTRSVSFGLSWEKPNIHASLDVWDYRYESGSGTYDWAGIGGYAGAGVSGERWSIDAGFGMYRADNKERTSRSSDLGFDSNLSLSYRAENLPDLSAGFFSGHYRTDYIAYGGGSNTVLSQFGLTLDFGKYLHSSSRKAQDQKLKLMYRYEDFSTDDRFSGQDSNGGHSIGLYYQLKY
jgi:hypothetical protein